MHAKMDGKKAAFAVCFRLCRVRTQDRMMRAREAKIWEIRQDSAQKSYRRRGGSKPNGL
jgi:hypothetical protein